MKNFILLLFCLFITSQIMAQDQGMTSATHSKHAGKIVFVKDLNFNFTTLGAVDA